MTSQNQNYFPPLRRKILKSFLVIIFSYIVLGFLLVSAVFFATRLAPTLIHVNYDSISAASKMKEAWSALQNSRDYSWKSPQEWKTQFEQAITFEEGNITEHGEQEISQRIRELWNFSKVDLSKLTPDQFSEMSKLLNQLIAVNEKGMFRLELESKKMRQNIFFASLAFFFCTVLLTILFADNLSNRLSRPIKDIAEILRGKPNLQKPLKLPEPNTLELSILSRQLTSLWEQLSNLDKLNLKQIVSQRNQLEAVLASVEDGILVLNNEEKVILCNEGMARILNLEENKILHHSWNDLPTLQSNYLKLRDFLRPNLPISNSIELEIGGIKLVLAARYRRIFGEQNEQIGSLYLLHDITQRVKFRQMREEWIGVLSHELKTPLQSLGTAADILFNRKEKFNEEDQMLLETLQDDVARIRVIANSFTQVGQPETQSLRLHLKKISLNQALKEWIKPFQVLAKDKNIRIELIEKSPEVWTNLDEVKFPWVLSNLISNALRVSPEKSKIQITLSSDENVIILEVADEGPGIPSEIAKRIFEPYYQGPQVGKRETQGFLGIGLTIAKEVVEAHEGKIIYQPRKPQGALFRIALPKA